MIWMAVGIKRWLHLWGWLSFPFWEICCFLVASCHFWRVIFGGDSAQLHSSASSCCFGTCQVRSSAVMGNSKVTSQPPQIITALARGSKLKKKCNSPITQRARATRCCAALMTGITVKVISYGQTLMTGCRVPSVVHRAWICAPCKHA